MRRGGWTEGGRESVWGMDRGREGVCGGWTEGGRESVWGVDRGREGECVGEGGRESVCVHNHIQKLTYQHGSMR